MYVCEVCKGTVGPGQAKVVHVVTRTIKDVQTKKPRTEIAREVAVCGRCKLETERRIRPVVELFHAVEL